MIDLLFVNKILVFEIESLLWHNFVMLLLLDDPKHVLSVIPKPKNRLQFWLTIVNISACYLQIHRILDKIFFISSSKDIKGLCCYIAS